MKKLLVTTLLGLIVLLFVSAAMPNDDGRAGRTGSPGESTCHSCHDDFALNSGGGSIVLGSTNLPDWAYVPGTTYHMTCTVARDGIELFGMGLEVLTTDNTNAGTLVITDPGSTQFKNAVVLGVNRRNVVHTLNGGQGEGSKVFSFDWVAPSEDIGEVRFYYAGVAANGSGSDAGDRVYTGSQPVSASINNGVLAEEAVRGGVSVVPLPIRDQFQLGYRVASAGRVVADLLDLQGRMTAHLVATQRGPGRHVEMIDRPSGLPAGTYLLRTEVDGVAATRTVILSDQ